MRALSIVVLTFATLASACSKTPEPDASSAPKTAAPEAVTAAPTHEKPAPKAEGGPSEITWEAPATWTKAANPSPMRKATYKIPKAAGDTEDAELSVTQAGGSVDANVERWAKQFENASATKKTERAVGNLKVTVIELSGTFAGGGMPGMAPSAPKTGWKMLAAIVDTAPASTFFKLTGPAKTVEAARGDFDKFIGTFKPQ